MIKIDFGVLMGASISLGKRENTPGQAEANLHGIALANVLDLDARAAGGILCCQAVRQSPSHSSEKLEISASSRGERVLL